jgi:hypothetical protein
LMEFKHLLLHFYFSIRYQFIIYNQMPHNEFTSFFWRTLILWHLTLERLKV